MATKMIKMKDLLYNSTRKLKNINLSVGMRSQFVSSLHTGRTKTAKISTFGVVLDKILNSEIAVCNVSGQPISYVEAIHRGKLVKMIVSYKSGKEFSVTADEEPPSDSAFLYGVASHVISNTMTQQRLFSSSKNATAYKDEFLDPVDKFLNHMRVWNDVFYAMCDCFYFALGNTGTIEATFDKAAFEAQAARLRQNGSLIPDPRMPMQIQGITAVPKAPKPKAETQPELFTEPLEKFFKRCKGGEFLVDYAWSDTQKKYIVPLSFLNTFIPTESFRLLLLSTWLQVKNNLSKMEQGIPYDEIMAKNPINIKVIGKPGSGKTTVIEAVLASMGYPKGLINCKDRMEEDEIEGMNKFVNGSIYSIPTKAGELHPVGGAVLLEEFNLPDPGILMGSLGQALAYPFILKVDGYKEYKRHPLTVYFATMNVGTEGAKPMNEALSSRFPEGHILEDVSKDEFVSILEASGYKRADCTSVYTAYKGIINYLRRNREDLVLSITLRHCLSALDKMRIGFTKKQAFEATFISQLYSSDPEIVDNIRSDVLKAIA